MDYTKLLEDAIKERELKKEQLQEYIADLKMYVKNLLKTENVLTSVGYSYSNEVKLILNKIENITVNTVNTITEEDKQVLSNEYTKSQNLIKELEHNIQKLLGISSQPNTTVGSSDIIGTTSNTSSNEVQETESTLDILGLLGN